MVRLGIFLEPSASRIKKNDQFFGASDVKLDGVEFSIITDSQTAALSFENGDLDIVTLSGNLVEQYEDDPRFSTRSDGLQLVSDLGNMKKEGLDNVNIRKALAKSYDKEAITNPCSERWFHTDGLLRTAGSCYQ